MLQGEPLRPSTEENHKTKEIKKKIREAPVSKEYILKKVEHTNAKLKNPIEAVSWFFISLVIVFGFELMVMYSFNNDKGFDFSRSQWTVSSAIALICGTLMLIIRYLSLRRKKTQLELWIMENTSTEIQDDLQVNFFSNLIKLSSNYLDQYYYETKKQAEKSFAVTISISVFGALIIFAGIIMVFIGITEPAYVTVGAGVLSEFIAAVFFYLYNSTVRSMSKYHNKLVLSQNVSIALKIADSLPDLEQPALKTDICKQLLDNINGLIATDDK